MQPTRLASPIALSAWAIATLCVVLIDWDSAIRSAMVIGFVGLCPGLAVVHALRLGNGYLQLVLAAPISLAVAGIVSGVAIYGGWWSPVAILMVLVSGTVVVAAVGATDVAVMPATAVVRAESPAATSMPGRDPVPTEQVAQSPATWIECPACGARSSSLAAFCRRCGSVLATGRYAGD